MYLKKNLVPHGGSTVMKLGVRLGAMKLFVMENYTVCRTSSTTYTL